MRTERLVIIGGGAAGLLAAYVYADAVEGGPLILEPGPLGGRILDGGLKYLRWSDGFAQMVQSLLGVSVWAAPVSGAILIDGNVVSYPDGLDATDVHIIQRLHWSKTRGVGEPDPDCMNAPRAGKELRIAGVSMAGVLDGLKQRPRWGATRVQTINPGVGVNAGKWIIETGSEAIRASAVIVTTPRAAFSAMAPWANVKSATARTLRVMRYRADPAAWDYLYTPYAPLVHRISQLGEPGGVFDVEFNCEALSPNELDAVMSFVRDVLGGGEFIGEVATMPGHLLPAPRVALPDGIRLLGRFAAWEPRATMDVVWERARSWVAEGWAL